MTHPLAAAVGAVTALALMATPCWADDRQYELVIYHCLEMNRTNCSSTTLPMATLPANPSAAYAQAQAMVAKFMAEHPGLTLRGFDMLIGRGA
jgi:ABC-type glycerol-3-phosphate transport system substrate-binding protein